MFRAQSFSASSRIIPIFFPSCIPFLSKKFPSNGNYSGTLTAHVNESVADNGQVEFTGANKVARYDDAGATDSNGLLEVYRVKADASNGILATPEVKISGVIDKGEVTLANLSAQNSGYYEAVVISDKLAASEGGEGTDALIGVEGLVFNWTNNNYLDHIGDWNTQTPVTKLSTSYKAFEYKHHNFDPAGNGGQGSFTETTVYRVNYEGTNFDDIIYWDSETSGSFQSMAGTRFALKDVSDMWFSGGLGDDTIFGATKTSDGGALASDGNADIPYIKTNFVQYSGSKSEYKIDRETDNNGNVTKVTIKHLLSDSKGGTGTDTLFNIDGAYFNATGHDYDPDTWTTSYFSPTIELFKEGGNVVGMEISGSEYNDTVDLGSAKYNNVNAKMDVFFSPNGSYHTTSSKAVDKFYGRTGEGKDILTLSGLFNRYEIKFIDKPMGNPIPLLKGSLFTNLDSFSIKLSM